MAGEGAGNRGGAGGEWKCFFAGVAEDHEAGLPVVREQADSVPLRSDKSPASSLYLHLRPCLFLGYTSAPGGRSGT